MSHQRDYFRSLRGAKPQGSPTPLPTDRLALGPLFQLSWVCVGSAENVNTVRRFQLELTPD